MNWNVSQLTKIGADNPWTIGDKDPTRGNLLWAISTRVPKHIARRLAWDGACWTYTGSKDRDGYGTASVGGSYRRVHRILYEAMFGEIPEGYDLHHERCGRKDCVDPRHVVAIPHGTHSRLTRLSAGAKLSVRIAEDIRARYAQGDVSQAALAAHYGVAESTVRAVLNGRSWKGVA